VARNETTHLVLCATVARKNTTKRHKNTSGSSKKKDFVCIAASNIQKEKSKSVAPVRAKKVKGTAKEKNNGANKAFAPFAENNLPHLTIELVSPVDKKRLSIPQADTANARHWVCVHPVAGNEMEKMHCAIIAISQTKNVDTQDIGRS